MNCRHWIGSDTKGRVCGAEVTHDRFPFCPKHLEIQKARAAKTIEKQRTQAERAETAWRDRNLPKLPAWRVQLERAEAEYARRTASPVDDRAAYGGLAHSSIRRAQVTVMSNTNVTRVIELQRIIKTLTTDIARAER